MKTTKLHGKMIVHVNQAMIKKARELKADNVPTLIVRRGSKSYYCRGVRFEEVRSGLLGGPGLVPQLDCGARTYFIVEGWITLIDPMTFREAKALLHAATCSV